MDDFLLLALGIFLSVLGTVNCMGNVSTIHSYNRRKVKEEDLPKYGKVVGIGTMIIGIALVLAYFLIFWSKAAVPFLMIPAIAIGLGFLLYGQIKYNRGIF